MKLNELRDLAIVLKQINVIVKKYSNTYRTGQRANDLQEEYEDIFLTACEVSRERIKHFLKKE